MSTLKFCPKCDFMLYWKGDKEKKVLLQACRNCDYQVVADDKVLHRSDIRPSVSGSSQNSGNMPSDHPANPRTRNVKCPQCGHGEAGFSPDNSEQGSMKLMFVCRNIKCGHKWID